MNRSPKYQFLSFVSSLETELSATETLPMIAKTPTQSIKPSPCSRNPLLRRRQRLIVQLIPTHLLMILSPQPLTLSHPPEHLFPVPRRQQLFLKEPRTSNQVFLYAPRLLSTSQHDGDLLQGKTRKVQKPTYPVSHAKPVWRGLFVSAHTRESEV